MSGVIDDHDYDGECWCGIKDHKTAKPCIVCNLELVDRPLVACTTHDQSEIAKAIMARSSSVGADRSKKRPYDVEKYLYQFQHRQGEGGGEGKTATYRDGRDRIFGTNKPTEQ